MNSGTNAQQYLKEIMSAADECGSTTHKASTVVIRSWGSTCVLRVRIQYRIVVSDDSSPAYQYIYDGETERGPCNGLAFYAGAIYASNDVKD